MTEELTIATIKQAFGQKNSVVIETKILPAYLGREGAMRRHSHGLQGNLWRHDEVHWKWWRHQDVFTLHQYFNITALLWAFFKRQNWKQMISLLFHIDIENRYSLFNGMTGQYFAVTHYSYSYSYHNPDILFVLGWLHFQERCDKPDDCTGTRSCVLVL